MPNVEQSTTSKMIALYNKTGGDIALSLDATADSGCLRILNTMRHNRHTGATGATRFGITKRASIVALDGNKAASQELIAAHGGLIAPSVVR